MFITVCVVTCQSFHLPDDSKKVMMIMKKKCEIYLTLLREWFPEKRAPFQKGKLQFCSWRGYQTYDNMIL